MDWADELENNDLAEVVLPKVMAPPPMEAQKPNKPPSIPPANQKKTPSQSMSYRGAASQGTTEREAPQGKGASPQQPLVGAASDRWKNYKPPASMAATTPVQILSRQNQEAPVRDNNWRKDPATSNNRAPPVQDHRDRSRRSDAHHENRRLRGEQHKPPQPATSNKALSQGIITSLKDNFGFIQMVSEPSNGDVFFHFDEVSKSGSCSPGTLKVGDEVEFELVLGKSNRLSATRLKVLDQDILMFDKPMEGKQQLLGVVVTETFRPQQSHNRGGSSHFYAGGGFNQRQSFSQNAVAPRLNEFIEAKNNARYWTGRIMLLTEEEAKNLTELVPGETKTAVADGTKIFCFASRGVKKPDNEATGDNKEKSKSEENDDDTGSVGTAHTASSYRRRNGRKQQISMQPQRGDLVRFDVAVELATGRIHANNIKVITFGSTRVQSILQSQADSAELKRERGRVVVISAGRPWSPNLIGAIECEERNESVSFYYRDLPESLQPASRKSHKKEDSSVSSAAAAAAAAPTTDESTKTEKTESVANKIEHKQHGGSRSKGKGFASNDWRLSQEASKKTAAEILKKQGLHVGTELEFVVLDDPLVAGRKLAFAITECPPGTIKLEEELAQGVKAKVVQINRLGRGNSHMVEQHQPRVAGKLELIEAVPGIESEKNVTVDFTEDEVVSPAPTACVRDIMSVDVYRIKRSGQIVLRSIQLLEAGDEALRLKATVTEKWEGKCRRESGVVNNVRDSFGFIDCYDRPGQIFFPLKEVISIRKVQPGTRRAARDELLTTGDCVSFQVDLDQIHDNLRGGRSNAATPRRTVATRVMKIPSVEREIVLVEKVTGIVSKAPVTTTSKLGSVRGGRSSRGQGRETRQEAPTQVLENGRIQCDPQGLLDASVFEKLVSFAKNELEVKTSNGNEKASKIVFDVSSKVDGSNKRAAKSKQDATTDVKEPFLKMSASLNTQALVREYCAWLGLQLENGPNSFTVRRRSESDESRCSSSQEPQKMSVAFSVAAITNKRTTFPGDKVEFRLCFDKRSFQYVARDVNVIEAAKKQITGPVERRPNSETGIVALIHDQGYGFLQCADRPERLFFHQADCEGDYRHMIEVGDEVEFIVAEVKQGLKATSLRLLPNNTVVADDPVLGPEDSATASIRGVILKEPKPLAEVRSVKWKTDHWNATQLALRNVPIHLMGKVMESSGATGQVETSSKNPKSSEKSDWRRGKELLRMVERFDKEAEKDEVIWKVDSSLPLVELKDIERLSRRAKLYVAWKDKQLIVSKTKKDYEAMLSAEVDTNSSRIKADDDGDEDEEQEEDEANIEDLLTKSKKADQSSNEKEDNEATSTYLFSLADLVQPNHSSETESTGEKPKPEQGWIPAVGDEVEFKVCRNRADKRVRATDIRLISSSATLYRGIIEGQVSDRFGFVRPSLAGRGLYGDGNDAVDESFRPGAGGRDGSIRFDRAQVRDNVQLSDGDEVEYTLVINKRTKEAKATRLRLITKAVVSERPISQAPPQLNRSAIKRLGGAASAVAVQRFHNAKGPDGTKGFQAGRGRNIPIKTKLRVTAKEFTPGS